jgi:uncharacterized protein (TIGR02453 family)
MAKAKAEEARTGAFAGFSPALFDFFETLEKNQTRDWFLANKAAYERHVRGPMAAFVESLALAFAAHEIPLTGGARASLFRPNRDTRFSNDKRPYKTNVAAVMSRDGTKAGKGVFYISLGGHHVGANHGGMMGAGFYRPEPDDVAAMRGAIAAAPQRWAKVEADLAKAGLALERGEPLSRLPKGFEAHAGTHIVEALKLRGYHVWRPIPEARLFGADLIDEAVSFARGALPLLDFGWTALKR